MAEPDVVFGAEPESDELGVERVVDGGRLDVVVREGAELAAELETSVSAVEAALQRLEEGRYGRCEICDRPLVAELVAEPTSVRCGLHDGP